MPNNVTASAPEPRLVLTDDQPAPADWNALLSKDLARNYATDTSHHDRTWRCIFIAFGSMDAAEMLKGQRGIAKDDNGKSLIGLLETMFEFVAKVKTEAELLESIWSRMMIAAQDLDDEPYDACAEVVQ